MNMQIFYVSGGNPNKYFSRRDPFPDNLVVNLFIKDKIKLSRPHILEESSHFGGQNFPVLFAPAFLQGGGDLPVEFLDFGRSFGYIFRLYFLGRFDKGLAFLIGEGIGLDTCLSQVF